MSNGAEWKWVSTELKIMPGVRSANITPWRMLI